MPGRLDIRILGPLEVARGDKAVPLGGTKSRSVLAILILRAGELVPTEELLDSVWGEDAPAGTRRSLQVHISKLRGALAEEGVSIEANRLGYRLALDPEQLDLGRFRRLLEEGKDALAAEDPATARDRLDRALSLWRGDPLAGLDLEGPAAADLRALEDQHLSAVETWVEVNLALGRHDEVLPELERLLAEHPLDERLHALAMLALYRVGRQNEALDLAARLRQALSTELGMEPGVAIGELERRILDHDPTLVPEIEPQLSHRTTDSVREGRKTITALAARLAAAGRDGTPLDPEASRGMVEELTRSAREVIEGHGGTVTDAPGATLIAVFGMPQAHEDDAVRGVRAAIELHELARADPTEETDPGPTPRPSPEMRIGVAAGEVLIQDTGGDQRLLSADPLEAARHLAGSAKPGETLLTQAVVRLAHHEVGAEPTDVVLLTDPSQPVVAHRLMGVAPAGIARRPRSDLVGRVGERRVLAEAFDRAEREPDASLVTVLGPAGVGKTRLVSEFVAELGDRADVLTGRCLPYGRDITYWPVAEMVRRAAGITATDTPRIARNKVARRLKGVEDAKFLAAQIAGALGFGESTPVPDEIFWAIRRLFETLARSRSLVLVFDDIHWADATLLDLIEHLVTWSKETSILVVAMARPELVEARAGWGGGRLRATNLTLDSLTREETAKLAENLLGRAGLVGEARERVLDAAEGHPLFLEELLAMLIDDGMLVWDEGHWTATADLADVPIPPTVQALLASRLDRLSPDERRTIEQAAVIGKEFSEHDLRELQPDADLAPLLEALAGKDLLVPDQLSPAEGHTYLFRHILVRDAVYQGTSKERRASDHERYGAALTARSGERLSEVEEIVGYHLESACLYRTELGMDDEHTSSLALQATAHLASAGRRAFDRDDMAAAASLLGRAMDLLPEGAKSRLDIAARLGVALFYIGQLARSAEVIDAGLELAERFGDESIRWRLRLERDDLRFWREPETLGESNLIALTDEAIAVFERLGDLSGIARAYRLRGDALSGLGRYRESAHAYQEGTRIALEAGDEREAAERSNFGVDHGPIPVEEGIRLIRSNLERGPRTSPESLAQLGFLTGTLRRFDEANELLDQAVARAEEIGVGWRNAGIRMYEGLTRLLQDDPVAAEESLRPAVESLQQMGERSMMSTAVAILARALYAQGRYDEALDATLESEEATADHDVVSQILWRGVRSKVLATRGDLEAAERVAREGTSFADETDLLTLSGDAHLDLATVLNAAGDSAEAAREIERALELYEQKGDMVSAGRARTALEEHLQRSTGSPPGDASAR